MQKYTLKKLVIKPTMSCTANCRTCRLRRDLHKSLINQKKLSFEQWLQIFKDAAGLGVERLDISGGEPTLYKNLAGLIKAGKEYGWFINLNTNGSLINESYAKELIEAGLDSVSISIYSAEPKIHDEMRNCDGLWQKATDAVRIFNRLRANCSNFQIITQCLICRENYKGLADLIKLDYELGSDRIALTYLEGDFEKQYLLREDEINDFKTNVIPKARAFCETLDTAVKNKAVEVIESVFSEKINSISDFVNGQYNSGRSSPCQRPREFTILLANGDVHPCNMVEYSHEPVMGNLFENSLPQIWHSEKWNLFREKLFEYCRLCPINLYMSVPLRSQNARQALCVGTAQGAKSSQVAGQEIKEHKVNISPSMSMHQMVTTKHRHLNLGEHGYPDIENSQFWSYEKLLAFQNARLKVILEYAYNNIPGYRRKFDNAGLKPADIKTIDDLKKLPITSRQELQNNQDFINPKLVTGTLYTGGSTGTSLKYYESEISNLIRNEVHLRGWRWGGFQHDMKYCILKSSQAIKVEGNCIHLVGDLTDENLKKNVDIIKYFKPQHLKGYVGSLFILAKYCIDNNIQIDGLKSVIPSSENLYDYQRRTIEQAFGCRVFEEYCCNDGGACAWECDKREGLHYFMERAVIEEEQGKMIVTDLWNLAMPFIRYENGDSVKFLDKKCSCGRQLPLIKVKGRTNDIIITPKGIITPSFLLHHGIGLVGVDKGKHNFRSGFRAVQYVQKPGNILEVNVVRNSWCTSSDVENFKKDLNEFISGLHININFVDNIPTTKKGKRAFVINEDKELLSRLQDNNFAEAVEQTTQISSGTENIKNTCNAGPRISVLLCVYNGQKYIRQALTSIYRQSYQDFEVVIVDDASTDNTSAILRQVKDSRTLIHRNPENIGLTKSLNVGISLCRGEYIARMDADDVSLPQRFEKQAAFLNKNSDCAAVGAWCLKIDEENRIIDYCQNPEDYEGIKRKLPFRNSILHGTAMIRKDALCKIGCYNEKYRLSQDYDLWLRMSETMQIRNIGEFLYLLRNFRDSISNVNKQQQEHYAELARMEAGHRRNKCDVHQPSETMIIQGISNSTVQNAVPAEVNSAGKEKPKVSIVISCYNCEKYLPACLESIEAQTMRDWELFLLDDASSDSTKMLIEKFSQKDKRVKPYYFTDNKGPYARRNFAIEQANSDFIIIHDSDDIMHPWKLQRLYEEIIQDPELAIVGSSYLLTIDQYKGFDYADKMDLPRTHKAIMERYEKEMYLCWHGSAIIRKNLFNIVGLYDEHSYGSDKFWLAKAGEYARATGKVKFRNIPEYLTYKIEHATSQQGTLSTLDPRSGRAGFQTYWFYKLVKIRELISRNPSVDVASELKNCKCSDYISRYGHLFGKWEKIPVDDVSLRRFMKRAIEEFNKHLYINSLLTLNGIEKMKGNVTQIYKNFDLLRAMSYYATGDREKCRKYLDDEIRNHHNLAAMQFISDYYEKKIIKTVDAWCIENASRHDLWMIYAGTTNNSDQPAHVVNGEPLVSVIMPAYNASEYIAQSIESVLCQDYRKFELVIINDGSTDDTEKIIAGFHDDRIRYFSQENRGLAATCNVAIKKSLGAYIVKLDSDDMMTPDFLRRHIEEFEKNPQIALVYCDDCLIDHQGKITRIVKRPEYKEQKYLLRDIFRNGYPVVPFRTCIKKSVFEKIGLYDEELLMAEDYDMIRRFLMHGLKPHHLPGALYIRRMVQDSLSRAYTAKKAAYHFDVVDRFVESFDYKDLFPDINWNSIPPEQRQFKAKCLIAETFLGIGQSYVKDRTATSYVEAAYEKARNYLKDALRIDPNSIQIRQLLKKYETRPAIIELGHAPGVSTGSRSSRIGEVVKV
jgi:glycosyltransferase involved in cell wall biosynthesis/phenylacetate-coenzyme A ligase PaaK-like adenylate-forming protein/MoaA/NifB/PqqE/SkfB family radical SAM enzyme